MWVSDSRSRRSAEGRKGGGGFARVEDMNVAKQALIEAAEKIPEPRFKLGDFVVSREPNDSVTVLWEVYQEPYWAFNQWRFKLQSAQMRGMGKDTYGAMLCFPYERKEPLPKGWRKYGRVGR